MKIEEEYPKKPNFGLIVGLFAAAILLFFVIAIFFLDWDGKHLTMKHHRSHPTSELVLPGAFAIGRSGDLGSLVG